MASGNSIIVGGGIQSGSPFTLGRVPYITNVSPAQVSSSLMDIATDSVSAVVYVSIPNSAGVYNAITNATETLRVQGGAIISGPGTDSVQIGRGASATTPQSDQVAIGRAATASANGNVVIGAAATSGGNAGVVIGKSAAFSGSAGVAIGENSALSAGAGGAVGTAIGQGATASFQAAGNSLVIGVGAHAVTGDTVVGDAASSSTDSAFGVFNVVIGNLATANIAGGNVFAVVVGANSSSAQKLATVIGSGSSATVAGQTRAVVIGSGSHANTTDAIVIGGGSTLTSKSIAIGAGAAEIGVGTMQLGAPSTPISTVIIGEGNTKASSAARAIRFTNASGTDNGAGDLTIIAPLSTGAATPAKIVFQVGAVAGSSAVLQTATAVLTIDDQKVTVAGTFVAPATFNASALPTAAGAAGTLWVDTGAANVVKRV